MDIQSTEKFESKKTFQTPESMSKKYNISYPDDNVTVSFKFNCIYIFKEFGN
jgi:hypothetical protein